jgi:hypothetical protein
MAQVNASQWSLLGSGSGLRVGQGYTLSNSVAKQSVRYGSRKYGINLVWDDAADLANVSFHRQGSSTAPVSFGERLAIGVEGGGYVRYGERDNGINLVWSSTLVYEWELTGGTFAQQIPLRQDIQLFNRHIGDLVVYGERNRGINLRWWSDRVADIYRGYVPLPTPPDIRAPSGEPGQVQIVGTASKVSVFHGSTDDELDWHIYVSLPLATRDLLFDHFVKHVSLATKQPPGPWNGGWRPLKREDLDRLYCEWMVLDGYDNKTFDELFYSADVRRALMLGRGAWDIGAQAAGDQGDELDVTTESELCIRNARVLLQGPLVNDAAHGLTIEIHPLDSIAYAISADGVPLAVGPEVSAEWPESVVTWRVAAFTNSSFHRINKADFLKKNRRITWYLDLPRAASRPGYATSVSSTFPTFMNQARGKAGLDRLRPTSGEQYKDYGLLRQSSAIETEPRSGARKLRVSVEMREPKDEWGGMFLGEYRVTSTQPVVKK